MTTPSFNYGAFDPDKVPDAPGFQPLPEGEYGAIIKSATDETTKDGTGLMLKVEWTIMSPASFKGRTVFQRINLVNRNQTAVEIGHRELKKLSDATGVRPKRSADFTGKKGMLTIGHREYNGKVYDEVKGVAKVAGAAAPAPVAAPAHAAEEDAPWA